MDSNNFSKSSAPFTNIQKQSNSIIIEPSLNTKFNSVVQKKINNKIFAKEEKIYPKEKPISQSVKQKNIKYNYNTNTNKINKYSGTKEQMSRTMVHQSPILSKNRVIQIDKNLQSSGTLLTSSRSSKFNKVLKNGKQIKNIDINNDCEDNKNEEEAESVSTTIIVKNSENINNNILLNSNNSKNNKLGPIINSQNMINNFGSGIDNIDNQMLYKTERPKQTVKMSKFFNQKKEKENSDFNNHLSENKTIKKVKEKPINQSLNSQSNNSSKTSEQIINQNNQSINELKKGVKVVKLKNEKSGILNDNNISTNSNQPKEQASIPLFQMQKKITNNEIPNNYDNTVTNHHSNENKIVKLSEDIKQKDDEKSKQLKNNINVEPLKDSSNSLNNNINNNLNKNNPTGSYLVTHLDEYIKNEIEPVPFYSEDNISQKKEKGFRLCGELTKAGKNAEGKTKTDQDTPLISISIGGVIGFNLFGVLDGHGPHGHFVSQFCKDYFIKNMTNLTELLKITRGITTAEEIYKELKSNGFNYITELYNKVDLELVTQENFDYNLSGTTCNIIFQFNKHLVCCSVGDSRSILIYDKGDYTNQGIYPLSNDHKPNLPEEFERIKLCGGAVDKMKDIYGNKIGPPRVYKEGFNYPGLAMSRSLGDMKAKEVGVIPTPEIIEYDINSNAKYLLVCSDGVWEFAKNQQIRDIANIFYQTNDIGGLCTELVKFSINLWEKNEIIRDDITVVAVFF